MISVNRENMQHTKKRNELRIVIRHNKQVDSLVAGASFQVAKRVSYFIIFSTAGHEHLSTHQA
jgi:hypothetical protein